MVRWMCGVSPKTKISSVDLNGCLGLEEVADIVRHGRLRWFGHLKRKGRYELVSTCRSFEVAGPKSRDRHKKTWDECSRQDLRTLNLKAEWAQDRTKWRSSFGGNHPDDDDDVLIIIFYFSLFQPRGQVPSHLDPYCQCLRAPMLCYSSPDRLQAPTCNRQRPNLLCIVHLKLSFLEFPEVYL